MYYKTFSIGDVLEQGWELFKKYWMMALLILGASIITSMITSSFQPFETEDIQEVMRRSGNHADRALAELLKEMDMRIVASYKIVETILQAIIMVGLVRMVMLIIKGIRDEISFEAFNVPFSTYLKYVATELLVSLMTGVGLLFCIIPGIVIGLRLQFATYCLLDNQETGIIEAIKMSWNMTRGNFWRLLLFGLAAIGICILGILCCCIGIYAALAWLLFADVLIYFALRPDEPIS